MLETLCVLAETEVPDDAWDLFGGLVDASCGSDQASGDEARRSKAAAVKLLGNVQKLISPKEFIMMATNALSNGQVKTIPGKISVVQLLAQFTGSYFTSCTPDRAAKFFKEGIWVVQKCLNWKILVHNVDNCSEALGAVAAFFDSALTNQRTLRVQGLNRLMTVVLELDAAPETVLYSAGFVKTLDVMFSHFGGNIYDLLEMPSLQKQYNRKVESEQSRDWEQEYEEEFSNKPLEGHDRDVIVEWDMDTLGFISFCVFVVLQDKPIFHAQVPLVASLEYRLKTVGPCAIRLLNRRDNQLVAQNGLRLATTIVSIQPCSLKARNDMMDSLLLDIISYIAAHADAQAQRGGLKALHTMLSIIDSGSRLDTLFYLYKACPIHGARALVIDRIRTELRQEWSIEKATALVKFASKNIQGTPRDELLELLDPISSLVILLQFILLRGKSQVESSIKETIAKAIHRLVDLSTEVKGDVNKQLDALREESMGDDDEQHSTSLRPAMDLAPFSKEAAPFKRSDPVPFQHPSQPSRDDLGAQQAVCLKSMYRLHMLDSTLVSVLDLLE